MDTTFRLRSVLFFVISIICFSGCAGKKETVNYEPRPDPFPTPEEETFTGRLETETDPLDLQGAQTEPEITRDFDPFILNTVYFNFDESRLTSETRSVLAANARQLQNNPDAIIRIEGHCDERGTVEYNLALGERRAIAVRNYLVNFGISRNRMTVISYGKERPIDPRSAENAWSRNRRAEFVILN